MKEAPQVRVHVELPDDDPASVRRIMAQWQDAGYGVRRVRIISTGKTWLIINGIPVRRPDTPERQRAADDAAYRAALGLSDNAKLPSSLGPTGGSRGGASGTRIRRQRP
jgi:hypothetical protein